MLGPERIPRVTLARARQEPWLAVLSGLVHGNGVDGTAAALAALAALEVLPEDQARLCYDLIDASLNDVARRALEVEMQTRKYEYQSEFARRYFGEGEQKGLEQGRHAGQIEGIRSVVLTLAERHGPVSGDLRARVEACAAGEVLHTLAVALAGAADLMAVEQTLARLPPATTVAG